MVKRVLFLVDSPFCQRDFDRYGIELLLRNAFDVVVWDLTDILVPGFSKHYQPPDPIDWPGCKVFHDVQPALKEIGSLSSETFVINLIAYSPKSYRLYRALSASQAGYAVITAGAVPSSPQALGGVGVLARIKRLGSISRLPKAVVDYVIYGARRSFYHLPYWWLGVKTASLLLAGGEESLACLYPVNRKTEIVWAHTFDYDLYLKERNTPITERPIAVFLDEYLPFHSDYVHAGIQPYVPADRYYPVLNRFFGVVERELGLQVVVAAHPRSHYEEHPDLFEGRERVRGNTVRLVMESRLVLAHFSTAVNFANLFRKPVVFVTSADLDRSQEGPYIRVMSGWYGHRPVFMDSDTPVDWTQELTVSTSHYDRYRRAYIKTEGSEDLPFWQIVANRLKGVPAKQQSPLPPGDR